MQTVGQILRNRHPSAAEKIAALLPSYRADTSYPEELDGGYYSFTDPDELRDFLHSSEYNYAIARGARVTMLQMNGTSVWIKYPRNSVFYQERVRRAIQIKNECNRKKLFFARLGKLMFDSLITPKQNPA